MPSPVRFKSRFASILPVCVVALNANIACRDYDCADTASCPVVAADAGHSNGTGFTNSSEPESSGDAKSSGPDSASGAPQSSGDAATSSVTSSEGESSDSRECDAKPCENGTCVERAEGYTCDCGDSGFSGPRCDIPVIDCEQSPCENGGVCTDEDGTLACDCDGTGYQGVHCEVPLDDCSGAPCDALTTCEDLESGFVCSSCPEGYSGSGETGCQNIDDCADAPCEHGTCLDGVAGYTCDCGTTGYSGKNCEVLIENCAVSPCENGGSCTDVGSSRTCDCSGTGATGESCEVEIDECATNPCRNGGACTDGNASFSCDCSAVDYSGSTCSNRIDDCTPNPCRNGGTCTDGNRSYTCNCAGTGYSGNQCQNDINDCAPNPCKNGGQCTDTGPNSFSCACTGVWSGSTCSNATLTIDVGAYGYYTNLDWFPPGSWAMVGYGASLGEYRTFLVFPIPTFEGTIASATLRLNHERFESDQTTETVGVFSVDNTPISQLGSSSVDWLPGFADLGSGTTYGEFTARASTLGSILSIPLTGVNASIANARGGNFALGLAAITLSSSGNNELVHFLIDDSDVGQLRLVITP